MATIAGAARACNPDDGSGPPCAALGRRLCLLASAGVVGLAATDSTALGALVAIGLVPAVATVSRCSRAVLARDLPSSAESHVPAPEPAARADLGCDPRLGGQDLVAGVTAVPVSVSPPAERAPRVAGLPLGVAR